MSSPAPPNSPESPRAEDSLESAEKAWEGHPANPFNWPEKKKWGIILVAAAVTLLVGLNATAVTTPGIVIAESFHVSDADFPHSYWPVTVWNTAAAFVPMLGLPLLENFGIREGYLALYLVFILMVIPQAVAPNFATLLVSRAIGGAVGGILLNSMEQLCADLWRIDKERNLSITVYTYAYVAGVTLGPVLGALVGNLSWRWVFYVQLILHCALFPAVCAIMRETRGAIIRRRLNQKSTNVTSPATTTTRPPLSTLLYEAITRPAHLLISEPVVFSFTLWAAFCFGLVFLMTQSIPLVYGTTFGFGAPASGLVQLSLFIGETLGALACLPQNAYHTRSAARNDGVPVPEARLALSIPASVLGLAGGLFWYGWASGNAGETTHWMLPTAGLALVGFAIMAIITAVDLYIADVYARFAGSAISAVAMGENIFAAWLPLASARMYETLGYAWASTLLGFVALGLTAAPVALWWKGEWVRGKSRFIGEAGGT
ncbi:MAG: hypothetical protein LQ345_002077 [Seirophora villosa]|nr:MAG: hypothetical protein LQ345_002077 [Seirophora villosa]